MKFRLTDTIDITEDGANKEFGSAASKESKESKESKKRRGLL